LWPDLIWQIIHSPAGCEMGGHTFSYIDFGDNMCSPELMRTKLRKCQKLANNEDMDLKSFDPPDHTFWSLNTHVEEDFSNFRTDYKDVLGVPKWHSNCL
jgi:hypothetical protein